jgi:hypothetical protein
MDADAVDPTGLVRQEDAAPSLLSNEQTSHQTRAKLSTHGAARAALQACARHLQPGVREPRLERRQRRPGLCGAARPRRGAVRPGRAPGMYPARHVRGRQEAHGAGEEVAVVECGLRGPRSHDVLGGI